MAISSNADEIFRRMLKRKSEVTKELTAAAQVIGPALNAECKRILNEKIYSVEIPFKARASASVKKKYAGTSRQKSKGKLFRKWGRTGDLLREERFRVKGPVVILYNTKNYSVPRYNLGTPAGRNIATPGVQSVQWQAEAVKKLGPFVLAVRRRHVLKALRLG